MQRRKFMIAALASVLLSGLPAAAAAPQETDRLLELSPRPITVILLDYSAALRAQLLNGTLMVPGRDLLRAIGYNVEWDAARQTLTARHASKPALVFQAGNANIAIGSSTKKSPTAPFVADGTLQLPLRITIEAAGLNVAWSGANREALVNDPQALPRIRLTTRADNGSVEQPLNLTNYFRANMNIDVDVNLLPPDYYLEKNRVMIAAGDMGSMMLVENSNSYSDELFQSFSLDLTDELKDFPRLKQLVDGTPGARTVDGRIYGIPRPRDPHDSPFPAIRKDWLDVLGAAQPKTMDELYAVLKAMTQLDPDGNGKHDTYGMTGYVTASDLGSFAWVEQAFTGSPDRFAVRDGQVVDLAVGAGETEALKWLNGAYKEGLIDKEFPVKSEEQAMASIRDNRAGAAVLSVREAASLAQGKVAWTPLEGLRADSVRAPIAPWNTSEPDAYIVTRMSRVAPKTILRWLDQGLAMTESKAWDDVDGFDQADRSALQSIFGEPDLLDDAALRTANEPTRAAYESAIAEWRKTSYANEVVPAFSRLWSAGKYAELNADLLQMKLKVIMGAASLDDWEQYTKTLAASAPYKAMLTDLEKLKG
ncbi:extracellular solute-binding protein [Paenibacillus sacheonensis]|uniref:Extracellular solute-binding protein n=1 Tax=Paenibacillus sacheonensis TaxID=742054 RepID=A0A7X4YLL6_9BACL|nr:extracellular solute-binding protein [Paenibacillus sacheonensis]MBM7564016.1 ABC-type glycerol-3-phosphate transport system substrate-binding protein [Paenibacillus sacheonensis]NBC67649.1 extracellular solute-binding protein [Paenibacillus sacheonensis]